jgi:hypothetical protein
MLADTIIRIAEESRGEEHPYRRRPSSSGPERCIRSMVYHGLNYPRKPLTGRGVLVFDDSSTHEELTKAWLQKYFILAGAEYKKQIHLDLSDIGLSSPGLPEEKQPAIDWITIDPMTGAFWVTEHKAINCYTWARYEDFMSGNLPMDYMTQLAAYMCGIYRDMIAGKISFPLAKFDPACDHIDGILLIKNKNTAQYLEYIVKYFPGEDILLIKKIQSSNGLVADVLNIELKYILKSAAAKFDEVDKLIAAKTLPTRPYLIGYDYQCGFCPYGDQCWAGREEEIKAMKLENLEFYKSIRESIQNIQKWKKESRTQSKDAGMVSENVLRTLVENNISQIMVDDYAVSVKYGPVRKLDKTKIPKEILEKAYEVTYEHDLSIKKIKEEK